MGVPGTDLHIQYKATSNIYCRVTGYPPGLDVVLLGLWAEAAPPGTGDAIPEPQSLPGTHAQAQTKPGQAGQFSCSVLGDEAGSSGLRGCCRLGGEGHSCAMSHCWWHWHHRIRALGGRNDEKGEPAGRGWGP